MNTIFDQVADIVRKVLDRPDLILTPGSSARDVEGWDSLRNVNIIVAVEAQFPGCWFLAGEIDELENVGDFVRLVEAKLRAVRFV
jgi:acyl carrier protein